MKRTHIKRIPDPDNTMCEECYFNNGKSESCCDRSDRFIHDKYGKTCVNGHYIFKKVEEVIK